VPSRRDYGAEYARRKERAAATGTTPARLRVSRGVARGQSKREAAGHAPRTTGERHYKRLTHLPAKASVRGHEWHLEQWVAGPYPFTYPSWSKVQRIRISEARAAVEKFDSKQVRIVIYGAHGSTRWWDEKRKRWVFPLDWKTFVAPKSDVLETLKQAQAELDGYLSAYYQMLLRGIRPGRGYGPLSKQDSTTLRSVERSKEEEIMQRISAAYMKFDAEYTHVFAWAVSEAK